MVANMAQVFATAGIGVNLASTENFNLPGSFLDVEAGGCSGSTTAE